MYQTFKLRNLLSSENSWALNCKQHKTTERKEEALATEYTCMEELIDKEDNEIALQCFEVNSAACQKMIDSLKKNGTLEILTLVNGDSRVNTTHL